jgi:anti-anti-sigma factor
MRGAEVYTAVAVVAAGFAGERAERQQRTSLDPVDFVDSAGVGVLVGAHRAAQKAGRRFAIRRPSHRVSVLLEVTGLNRLFAIEEGA